MPITPPPSANSMLGQKDPPFLFLPLLSVKSKPVTPCVVATAGIKNATFPPSNGDLRLGCVP